MLRHKLNIDYTVHNTGFFPSFVPSNCTTQSTTVRANGCAVVKNNEARGGELKTVSALN